MSKSKAVDNKEQIVVEGNDRMFILTIEDFDKELFVDDVLRIDFSNILGEVLTFPVLMNRVGLMRAEMQQILNDKKLDLNIYEARMGDFYRKKLIQKTPDAKGDIKTKAPSNDMVNAAVTQDEGYQQVYKQWSKVQKNFDIIDSFYWACKSKDDKLNKLSEKLRPEEFEKELLEDTINGIMIKAKNKLIKNKN